MLVVSWPPWKGRTHLRQPMSRQFLVLRTTGQVELEWAHMQCALGFWQLYSAGKAKWKRKNISAAPEKILVGLLVPFLVAEK